MALLVGARACSEHDFGLVVSQQDRNRHFFDFPHGLVAGSLLCCRAQSISISKCRQQRVTGAMRGSGRGKGTHRIYIIINPDETPKLLSNNGRVNTRVLLPQHVADWLPAKMWFGSERGEDPPSTGLSALRCLRRGLAMGNS